MSKKQSKTIKQHARSERIVAFFRWQRKKDFTVLEDFILRVIELKGPCSDSEIAKILCLEEFDISIILDSKDGYKYAGDIQGDKSRRSLCDGFSRDLSDGIAMVTEQSKKIIEIDNEKEEIADLEEICSFLEEKTEKNVNDKFSKEINKFRKEKNAKVYCLKISYLYNAQEADYRCGDVAVPQVAHKYMDKILQKNPTKKK